MKTETSAGGIIVRQREGIWEVLLICDSKGEWTFPKGHPEGDETLLAAAAREVAEETGLRSISYFDTLSPVNYLYTRDGLVKKTVQYFVFTTQGDEPLVLQTDEGISDAKWVSVASAADHIGYPKTNIPLLVEARDILHKPL